MFATLASSFSAVTDSTAFQGSGNDQIPIKYFAGFYVTGWDVVGNVKPCLDNDPHPWYGSTYRKSLDNGDVWSPHDYDGEPRGEVPLIRALAESLNLATVRLGLDVGLEPIAKNLGQLGLAQNPRLYPSMLLGALALSPLEVAQVYNTLANGGFRVPLRAVRSVLGEDGTMLQSYSMKMEQAADSAAVYALDQALVQVMERGTGHNARRQLPATVTVAGMNSRVMLTGWPGACLRALVSASCAVRYTVRPASAATGRGSPATMNSTAASPSAR